MIFKKIKKNIIKLGSIIILLLIVFYGIYDFQNNKDKKNNYKANKDDIYWAKKIIEGGFILHFRHTERDKWIDVTMYDALESDLHNNGKDRSRFAENDYFADAVCLNSRGKIQARAMGEHIQNIGLPIGHIASSVSCRARQTAELVFGKYDTLHRILVHSGPYNEERSERIDKLKFFYLNLPLNKNENTIVSAHNGVVVCEMFTNCKDEKLSLEEGGFYVISKKKDKLYLEYEFHNYNNFNKVFYKR